MTGDKRCPIGAKPEHRFGHLFGAPGTANRVKRSDLFESVRVFAAKSTIQHRRRNCAWQDSVNSNALLRVFQRRCFSETNHGMLAGDINSKAGKPDQSTD